MWCSSGLAPHLEAYFAVEQHSKATKKTYRSYLALFALEVHRRAHERLSCRS